MADRPQVGRKRKRKQEGPGHRKEGSSLRGGRRIKGRAIGWKTEEEKKVREEESEKGGREEKLGWWERSQGEENKETWETRKESWIKVRSRENSREGKEKKERRKRAVGRGGREGNGGGWKRSQVEEN